MSLPTTIYPASVDLVPGPNYEGDPAAGQVGAAEAKVFFDYGPGQPGSEPQRVQVYNTRLDLICDSGVLAVREGASPRQVHGRHEIELADGRTLLIQTAGGCGCGSKLKAFNPSSPARSGRRP